jgi:hypothetical protein
MCCDYSEDEEAAGQVYLCSTGQNLQGCYCSRPSS